MKAMVWLGWCALACLAGLVTRFIPINKDAYHALWAVVATQLVVMALLFVELRGLANSIERKERREQRR